MGQTPSSERGLHGLAHEELKLEQAIFEEYAQLGLGLELGLG